MKNVGDKTGVLFVCLGNICRSPLAEGIFRAAATRRGLCDRFEIDSCGTGSWHAGESPDPRSVEVAQRHGVDISGQRARQLARDDFQRFAWLIPMDRANEGEVRRRCPGGAAPQIRRILDFEPDPPGPDVPDPYYGGRDGFEEVYELLESAADRLLDAIVAAEAGPR